MPFEAEHAHLEALQALSGAGLVVALEWTEPGRAQIMMSAPSLGDLRQIRLAQPGDDTDGMVMSGSGQGMRMPSALLVHFAGGVTRWLVLRSGVDAGVLLA